MPPPQALSVGSPICCVQSILSHSHGQWLTDIMYTAHRQHQRLYASNIDEPVQNQAADDSLTISALLWAVRRRNERSGTENRHVKQERYLWAVFSKPSAPKGWSLVTADGLEKHRAWGGGGGSVHHALKHPEPKCKAMSNLHARPAFSSSSEPKTANLLPTQNRTW